MVIEGKTCLKLVSFVIYVPEINQNLIVAHRLKNGYKEWRVCNIQLVKSEDLTVNVSEGECPEKL